MRFRILTAACGLILSAAVLHAGGWGVISVERLPSHVTAGQPVELTYAFRQHGIHLAAGLPARVEATSGAETVVGIVRPDKRHGFYTASFTLPHPGEWVIVIHSGHGTNPANATWLPMVAVRQGDRPPTYSSAEQGARLFVAKGCMTCHRHPAISTRSAQASVGMLGTKALTPAYIANVLRHPPRVEDARRPQYGRTMPDLSLSDDEIDALTAFLTDAPRSTRR